MKHRARKRFGQNFLTNAAVIQNIVCAIAPQKSDTLVEIGPGMGALTEPLAEKLDAIIAIEIDRDLQAILRANVSLLGKLELINQDALTIDFRQWGKGLRVVGNLPYNISTPLLMHLLDAIDCIEDMHFMLQKEVVQRMSALPGSKTYGRLSIICQYYCDVEQVFDVPAECFSPKPKVASAIVRLQPHKSPIYPYIDRKALEAITAKGFSMRRKTLANNLKGLIRADELEAIGINPLLRPEQIAITDWVRMGLMLKNANTL